MDGKRLSFSYHSALQRQQIFRRHAVAGTEAQGSLAVLEGFIEEELAGCRCCLSLSKRVSNQSAARLLRRIAGEKQAAARELCAARFLITGQQYAPAITGAAAFAPNESPA